MTKREKNAVENFLGSLFGMTKHEAYANAKADAKSYKWSDEALKTVIDGIAKSNLKAI